MFKPVFRFFKDMFMLLSNDYITAHSGILFSGEMAAILNLEAILDLKK